MLFLWYNRENKRATARVQPPVAWPNLSKRCDMPTIPPSPGIYKVTCLPTGKVYIGSTTDIRKRWLWHRSDLRAGKHHNRHLQNAWNKHGEAAFMFEILEMVMFVEYLHEREQYWLDHFQAHNPQKGFNFGKVARAPWLGRSHSTETRQKLSARSKANVTDEQIARITAAGTAWRATEAGRQHQRARSLRMWGSRQSIECQCDYCGAAYETRSTHQRTRFCSNNCKAAARRETKVDREARTCEMCGVTFTCNKYFATRCCSESCAAKMRWAEAGGSYLSEEAEQRRVAALRAFWAGRQPVQKQCAHCGASYETTCAHGRAKFCSPRCKQSYYRRNKP